MKRARRLIGSVLTLGVLAGLTLLGETAAQGVRQGIRLCLDTVIPALFVFTVVSSFLGATTLILPLGRAFSRIGRPIFRLTERESGIFLLSLLGGYPVGAALLAKQVRGRSLSAERAARLLCFCSWCSPAFLIQGVGTQLLKSTAAGALLWGVQVLAALLLAFLLREKKNAPLKRAAPVSALPAPGPESFLDALAQGTRVLGGICATVVFSGAVLSLLALLPLPSIASWILRGICEVTVGCFSLPEGISGRAAFAALGTFTGFGGLCVLGQNAFVLRESKISLRPYLLTRILLGAFCGGMCYWLYPLLPAKETACFGNFYAPAGAAAMSESTPLGSFLLVGLGIFFLASRFFEKSS